MMGAVAHMEPQPLWQGEIAERGMLHEQIVPAISRCQSGCGSMCATARIMRSKSARSSRRERQGQAQAHRARPQSEGAGEGAAQDATAQGAQVREALSATGEASGPDGGRRLKFCDGIQRFV